MDELTKAIRQATFEDMKDEIKYLRKLLARICEQVDARTLPDDLYHELMMWYEDWKAWPEKDK